MHFHSNQMSFNKTFDNTHTTLSSKHNKSLAKEMRFMLSICSRKRKTPRRTNTMFQTVCVCVLHGADGAKAKTKPKNKSQPHKILKLSNTSSRVEYNMYAKTERRCRRDIHQMQAYCICGHNRRMDGWHARYGCIRMWIACCTLSFTSFRHLRRSSPLMCLGCVCVCVCHVFCVMCVLCECD